MSHLVDAHDDGRTAQEMFDHGCSWIRIAAELGYTVPTVRQLAADYCARLHAEAHEHQTTLF